MNQLCQGIICTGQGHWRQPLPFLFSQVLLLDSYWSQIIPNELCKAIEACRNTLIYSTPANLQMQRQPCEPNRILLGILPLPPAKVEMCRNKHPIKPAIN